MSLRFEIREETNLEVVLPVRGRNLYPGKDLDPEVNRETDLAEGTMHLVAVQDDGRIIGCVTLAVEEAHDRDFRMRWIGVDEDFRGHGIGTALAQACLDEAARRGGGLWCNARVKARSLYRRLGFEELGNVFDIPHIGYHLVMRTP